MSKLFVSHGSAFRIYRMYRLAKQSWNIRATNIVPAESMTVEVDSVEQLKSETLLNKVDVLVSSRNRCYKNESIVFHNNCKCCKCYSKIGPFINKVPIEKWST